MLKHQHPSFCICQTLGVDVHAGLGGKINVQFYHQGLSNTVVCIASQLWWRPQHLHLRKGKYPIAS